HAASLEVRELVSATPIAQACETLEGRFVVGVVDGDTALVAADRFGQMDLYYQSGEGWAVLASDLSLLPVSGGGAAYDPLALAHALTVHGYRPPKRHTAYRGVPRVGVGEVAELGGGRMAAHHGVRLRAAAIAYRKQGPGLLGGLAPLFRSDGFASMTAVKHGVLADHVARTTGGDEAVFAGEISDGVHNLGFSQYVTIFHPVLAFREYSDKMASYLFGPTFFGLLLADQYANDPIYALLRGRAGDGIFEEPARDAA